MKRKLALFSLLLFAVASVADVGAAGDTFEAFRRAAHDPTFHEEVVRLARHAIEDTVLRGVQSLPPPPHHALLRRPAGVFVTLVENGLVRGCMGALEPMEPTAAGDIVRAAVMACTEDTRYPPLRPSEIPRVVPVVAIIGPRRRVQGLDQLDPLHLGLFVERDGRGAVLLPGEALSAGYQVNACKAKAGISMNAAVAMYTFPTVTFVGSLSQPDGHRRQR